MAIRSVSRSNARSLHPSRPVTALLALAALCVVGVTAPASASPGLHAKPKPAPTVGSVQSKLQDLAQKNSALVEKYNQARITAAKAAKAAKVADAAAAATAGRYALARQRYVQVIEDQYQNNGFATASALLSSTSNANYLDRLSSLSIVSDHNSGVVAAVAKVRTESINAANAAKAAAAKATAAQKAISADRKTVQAQIKTYKKTLAQLTAKQLAAFRRGTNPTITKADLSGLNFANPKTNPRAYKAVEFAIHQIGKPYVFGAAGPGSFDCSGLTMAAWAQAGVSLPHSSEQQFHMGTRVSESDLQPGDLLFYYPDIGHVTIYAGNGMMVSAPEPGEDVTLVPVAAYDKDYQGAVRL